jgi:hypothetical protein
MQTTLRMETTVLPGHRLEISNPELPDGATVEVIVLIMGPSAQPTPVAGLSPAGLRKVPREQRQAILAAAAALAEQDYRDDKELTGFEAFSEEELNDE